MYNLGMALVSCYLLITQEPQLLKPLMIPCWRLLCLQFCLQHICQHHIPRGLCESWKVWHPCINYPVTLSINNGLSRRCKLSFLPNTDCFSFNVPLCLSSERRPEKRHLASVTHRGFIKTKAGRLFSQMKFLEILNDECRANGLLPLALWQPVTSLGKKKKEKTPPTLSHTFCLLLKRFISNC